jgi:hypothetical protein
MYNNENSSVLQEVFQEMEAPKPPPPKVRQFTCSTGDLGTIRGLTKPSATSNDLKAAVEAAANTAVSWLWKAAGSLRISPRSAKTIKLFKEAFVKAPDWQPPWKPAKVSWVDFGDLIAVRLLAAAKILNGGHIKYFCYGDAKHCPKCTGSPTGYISCSSWGKTYTICLGDEFWKDWHSGNLDSLASNLIHEALHIYFGTTVAHSGRSGNASCYQRFVSEINGRVLLDRLKTRCPPSP